MLKSVFLLTVLIQAGRISFAAIQDCIIETGEIPPERCYASPDRI